MTATSNLCELSIARLSNYLASDYFRQINFPSPFPSPVLYLPHSYFYFLDVNL